MGELGKTPALPQKTIFFPLAFFPTVSLCAMWSSGLGQSEEKWSGSMVALGRRKHSLFFYSSSNPTPPLKVRSWSKNDLQPGISFILFFHLIDLVSQKQQRKRGNLLTFQSLGSGIVWVLAFQRTLVTSKNSILPNRERRVLKNAVCSV